MNLKTKDSTNIPPVERIGPFQVVGQPSGVPYIADRGFNGQRWIDQWRLTLQAYVLTVPVDNASDAWSAAAKHHLNSWKPVLETVFSILSNVFALNRVNAHGYQGLYTRVAAKCAASILASGSIVVSVVPISPMLRSLFSSGQAFQPRAMTTDFATALTQK